jgi:hypothetical protein
MIDLKNIDPKTPQETIDSLFDRVLEHHPATELKSRREKGVTWTRLHFGQGYVHGQGANLEASIVDACARCLVWTARQWGKRCES